MSFNALEGPVPPDLGFLPDVETLYLNNNKLSGDIPKGLALMTSLKYLRLENNELQGEVKPFGPDGVFHDEEHRVYYEGDPQQRFVETPHDILLTAN